jgi:GT2 family glycosyltransferase
MERPSDALVICTRNRIEDIKRCLVSVHAATYIPGRIIVVDSSDDRETEEYCNQSDLPITYIRAPRGLTIQRNIALSEVHEDIVHFIDDDVEIAPDYFHTLNQVLNDSPNTAGAGGAMARPGTTSAHDVTNIPGAYKRAFISRLMLKTSQHPGRVLRSGYNTGCFDSPNAINVEWLPGCSMSFRMRMIRGLTFDERRKGYALGEDVDFGLKALERGPLLYVPAARLVHHVSPANRADFPDLIRASVHNRWTLATDFPHRVSRGLVIYSSIAEGLWIGVRVIVAPLFRRNAPPSVRRERAWRRRVAFAFFAGVVDVLRGGSHVDL